MTDNQALIDKLKNLEGISTDERAQLIALLNTRKRYGLVWEDKPEAAEETLKTQLPVLTEVVERRIISLKQDLGIGQDRQDLRVPPPLSQLGLVFGEELPKEAFANSEGFLNADQLPSPVGAEVNHALNHSLIEGDNLHALTALNFTHAGRIDVIYIDPPYNTGNKDFKYNDHFVDREDGYRHSKWLSFMAKRLRLAKNLLSDRGVIFISIDDNEQAQLKLLCDEVFGEENFVANIIWQKVYSPRMDAKGFSVSHDYILTYKKIPSGNIQKLQFEQNTKQFNSFDKKRNQFYRARSLRKDGSNSLRADRPNLFYPLIAPDGQEIFPIKPDGKEGNWRWSLETYKANVMEENVEWVQKNGKWDILVKQWKVDDAQMPPPTLWLSDEVGHNHEAAEDIKSIFSESSFSTPKPLRLLKRILQIGGDKSATILDFFAGSGTTLHAVMALNAEDGGRRQCILVTNNENNICEEVTYERNRRVIEGYTNAKGVAVAGLAGNNLRYYRAGYVPSLKTEANKRALTQASTELLCLKENCYNDLTEVHGLAPSQVRVFGGEGGRLLVVVYYSRQMLAVMEQLVAVVETIDRSQHIKVYAFGPEKETLVEDLYPIADRIEIVPLPDAIYQAYRACFRTLKLDRAIINPTEA